MSHLSDTAKIINQAIKTASSVPLVIVGKCEDPQFKTTSLTSEDLKDLSLPNQNKIFSISKKLFNQECSNPIFDRCLILSFDPKFKKDKKWVTFTDGESK